MILTNNYIIKFFIKIYTNINNKKEKMNISSGMQ